MIMNYTGNIIRPPSEADSIILQVTIGCTHNKCTFCGAYKGILFAIKDEAVVDADLEFAARNCRRLRRVFLADGDVLAMPQPRLVGLLRKIRRKLPWIRRIGLYANARSIIGKSVDQLRELKLLGLDRVYLGLESGHAPTLAAIRKGADCEMMIESANRIRTAGIFLSVTVLLGIAGVSDSLSHAGETARVLNRMMPNQVAVLTLMLLENTPLFQDARRGDFRLPEPKQLLLELKTMLEHITLNRVQFQANHASNYFSINARLARDKAEILCRLKQAMAGDIGLRPEYMRGL
jgi:radical SAM superfamily enzyme YgiQ (UPF0313 family)